MWCWIYGLVVRSCMSAVYVIIVYRWKWLWIPANIEGAYKGAKVYVGRSMTVHNHLFSVIHRAWIMQPKHFCWLSSWYRENNYCVLCTVKSKKSKQKPTKKKFVRFHNHSQLWCGTTLQIVFFLYFCRRKTSPRARWLSLHVPWQNFSRKLPELSKCWVPTLRFLHRSA